MTEIEIETLREMTTAMATEKNPNDNVEPLCHGLAQNSKESYQDAGGRLGRGGGRTDMRGYDKGIFQGGG